MPKSQDLIGKQFGKLTVVEKLTSREVNGVVKKGVWWRSKCSCGGEAISLTNSLVQNVRKCKDCSTNEFNKEWVGKVVNSKNFGEFKVLSVSKGWAEVEFINTSFRTTTGLKEMRTGAIKDYLAPVVSGVGYLGVGDYQTSVVENGKEKNSPAYEAWNGVLKRCYNKEWQSKSSPTYAGVTVAAEWHNFQEFAKWYYNNKPSFENPAIDKDLKIIGNKEYNPQACSFVPLAVNSLFTGTKDDRELPRGVHFCNTKKMYIVQLQCGELTSDGKKKQTYLGQYEDREQAIAVYREAKVKHCAEVAERYKDHIDPIVYCNLMTMALEFI